eukprot:Pgem_evm1s6708
MMKTYVNIFKGAHYNEKFFNALYNSLEADSSLPNNLEEKDINSLEVDSSLPDNLEENDLYNSPSFSRHNNTDNAVKKLFPGIGSMILLGWYYSN